MEGHGHHVAKQILKLIICSTKITGVWKVVVGISCLFMLRIIFRNRRYELFQIVYLLVTAPLYLIDSILKITLLLKRTVEIFVMV